MLKSGQELMCMHAMLRAAEECHAAMKHCRYLKVVPVSSCMVQHHIGSPVVVVIAGLQAADAGVARGQQLRVPCLRIFSVQDRKSVV